MTKQNRRIPTKAQRSPSRAQYNFAAFSKLEVDGDGEGQRKRGEMERSLSESDGDGCQFGLLAEATPQESCLR